MAGDFTYTASKVTTEALHWIRFRIGQTRQDRSHITDTEIETFLLAASLTKTSIPTDNWNAVHTAAADCAEGVAAGLIRESEIAITEVGTVKSLAASGYFKLADRLLGKVAKGGAKVFFADPVAYATTHVAGVDPEPDLEA